MRAYRHDATFELESAGVTQGQAKLEHNNALACESYWR